MALNIDAKFERKLTFAFKNDRRNLGNFHQKVSKLGLWWDSFIQAKYELKIYRGVICHGNKKRCKIGRGFDLPFQNWHEDFDELLPEHYKISKNCALMDCLWPKYIMFELKKYRGVIFDGTEYWCKIWKKTDFSFEKWHRKFGKFSPEHLKVSKLGLWWDSFI